MNTDEKYLKSLSDKWKYSTPRLQLESDTIKREQTVRDVFAQKEKDELMNRKLALGSDGKLKRLLFDISR